MASPHRDKIQRTRIRVVIVVLVTLCPVICYISRLNLSLAIVAMIDEDSTTTTRLLNDSISLKDDNNSSSISLESDTTCPLRIAERSLNGTLVPSVGPKYNWTNEQAAMIQGAFFWTYVGCQIPVARAAEVFGPKWILATAGFGSAVFSFLAPVAADTSAFALTLTRFGMGATQTALYPASYIVYTKWLPPSERSLALPLLYMGAYVGSIISSTITGYLCESSFGWPSVFYLAGVVCASWTLAWIILSVDKPRDHKLISTSEIAHIEATSESTSIADDNAKLELSNSASDNESRGNQDTAGTGATTVRKSRSTAKRPDWSKIVCSLPIIGFTCVFFSSMWSFSVIMIMLPSYLNFVLRIPIFMNGIISSTIFALFCVASPLIGGLSAWLVHKQLLGLTKIRIRKLFEGVAIIGQGVCFFALPLMGCNQTLVLFLLALQILVYSLVNGGEVHQPSELSLDFAGTIYAIANTVGMSTGFLVPMVHGWTVENRTDRHQWNVFWIISGTISTIGGVLFVLLAKSDELDLELRLPDFDPLALDDNSQTKKKKFMKNHDEHTNCY